MSSNFAKVAVGAVLALLLVLVMWNSGEEVVPESAEVPAVDGRAAEAVRQRLGQLRPDSEDGNSSEDASDRPANSQAAPAAGKPVPQAPQLGQAPAPAVGEVAAPRSGNEMGRDTVTDVATLKSMALNDKDIDRRLEAVTLLGVSDDPEVVPVLGQALADEDADVRLAAIQALADFTDEGVFDLLGRAAMDDPEADNRYEALEALADVDEERAAAFAKRALQDKSEEVRDLAESILDID